MRRATARAYASNLRVHLVPALGQLMLKQITPLRVRAYVTALSTRRSPKTVRDIHALLSDVLRDAVLEGLLVTSRASGSGCQGTPRTRRCSWGPTRSTARGSCPEHYRALVQVAAGTGMR